MQNTFYQKYGKRVFDLLCAVMALVVFGWLYVLVAILVRIKLGAPVLFTQLRPGKDEQLFLMYKFRTMTDERDESGALLPDEMRLTSFGKLLRSSSLDELPEVFNIVKGDMSLIGPRPQLVRDLVFMTRRQRRRHMVRPGLSGLAQVNGLNEIDWEEKLEWDLRYVRRITVSGDLKILLQTVFKAFVRREGITEQGMATAEDFGDFLLRSARITKEVYEKKQHQAERMLRRYGK